ncbi:hypothetical protein, variant [Aphanomyces invadans]|uniref:Uncharacterized protein n=1 Tax=Aphanomyces invadans TaxID=157072 RepID=A0A024UPP1_9STRA|nr:hypothetical protein, variant [Aphanomyces invadans]ETW07812.1 hypothetical protein, variant [Aphanomyces invadans]|eukprot:XP_008863905.1 hypothetical protein, variant [Aphanomyces invadans]
MSKGLTLDAMRGVLAAFPTDPPLDEPTWTVTLRPTSCAATRQDGSYGPFQMSFEDGIDWRRLHEWIHFTTRGAPFRVASDDNFSLEHAKAAAYRHRNVHAMLLLHDVTSSENQVTQAHLPALQSFDRFVVVQGRVGTDSAVTFTVIHGHTKVVERHQTWPALDVTMAVLRHVDDWLCKATAGLSWVLVGRHVIEWVAACDRMNLPCPAYFHTWHDVGHSNLSLFMESLARGVHVTPTHSVASDVDVTLVSQQWIALCPSPPPTSSMRLLSPRIAQNLVELLPGLKAPCAKGHHELIKVAAIQDWALRHVLAGYLARGDIANGMTLDMVLAALGDGGPYSDGDVLQCISSDVDDMLW